MPVDPKLVSASTVIDAAPSVVFAILADPRQHPRIDGSGSVQNIVSAPDRLTTGSRFSVAMRLFGLPYQVTNKVVDYEDDRRIAWRHFGAHRWRYELEPVDGGTRVTETFDYSRYHPVAARVLEVLRFPERNRQGIVDTLARLKAAAESDAQR